mmetsp:Transcript_118944/g.237073  ORF Transcript_118944/g.237073 Transcript_118944/m.237073 type:complete len:321 (-) Transcript_118944:33-995(-)
MAKHGTRRPPGRRPGMARMLGVQHDAHRAMVTAVLLCTTVGFTWHAHRTSPAAWAFLSDPARSCVGTTSRSYFGTGSVASAGHHTALRASDIQPAASTGLVFDPNSIVDMTEQGLLNATFLLTSSVFGFPDFQSLIRLNDDGSVKFGGGMVSKEPGAWSVVEGDPEGGEKPTDLFLEFTQPLLDAYKKSFNIEGPTCFWRGKLDVKNLQRQDVNLLGGVVVSEDKDKKNFIREGIFTATVVPQEKALEVKQKAREAFNRALVTPKTETTGFKTPARIAGIMSKKQRTDALPAGRDPDKLDNAGKKAKALPSKNEADDEDD